MKIWAGFDLETTGLSQPDGHRIVEVGILLYIETEPGVATFKGQYVQRVNPQRPIDAKAQAIHGISFEELASEPAWHEGVAQKTHTILSRVQGIVAHNAGFDMPFVNGEFKRVGLPEIATPAFDTMAEGRWATPMGKYPNLGELCFSLGVDYDPKAAHSADYDVRVMMEAFFKARKKGFFMAGAKAAA